jgi:hypothetical protein
MKNMFSLANSIYSKREAIPVRVKSLKMEKCGRKWCIFAHVGTGCDVKIASFNSKKSAKDTINRIIKETKNKTK